MVNIGDVHGQICLKHLGSAVFLQHSFPRLKGNVMSHFEIASISNIRRRLSSVLLAAAMAVGLVAVTSNSASADFDTVTTVTPSNPAANSNQINDVSCVSTTFCMSVIEGRETSSWNDPADTFLTKWDGSAWSLVSTFGWPTNFRSNDIACVTTSLCLVAGGVDVFENMNLSTTPYLMLWNGSAISQVTLPSGVHTLQAVSCATATFCLAVGDSTETPRKSLVLRWDGTSLTRESSTMFTDGTNNQIMLDVDCDTTRRCVGVTSIDLGNYTYSGEILDRGAVAGMWSRLSGRTDSLTQLQRVNCQPGELGLCAIVGAMSNGNGAVLYDLGADMANKFRNISLPVVPSGGLTNGVQPMELSCVSTTRCLLVGAFMVEMPRTESYIAVWDGSTWTRLTSESGVGGSNIYDVECPAASHCVAVGTSKATSGMMAPNSASGWFIRDAALVGAPSGSVAPAPDTPAPDTPAPDTPAPVTPAPDTPASQPQVQTATTPTTAVPSTTAPVANVATTTTTLPAPALAVVKALPKASTPIVAGTAISTGEAITVSFGGFTPFEYVQLIVASTPKVIGAGYANAQGVVTISGNLPASLASGNHTLAVYAPVSGIGFSQPITVSQRTLPATGLDDQSLLTALTLFLLVGGLLLRRTRRLAAF